MRPVLKVFPVIYLVDPDLVVVFLGGIPMISHVS